MLFRIILTLVAASSLAFPAIGCATAGHRGNADEQTLTVFAAASLAESLQELATAFEDTHPDVTLALHFAGSQTLRTQLVQGAAADVFAPADWQQMAAVQDSNLLANTPLYFAANRMAVVTAADSGDSGAVQSLSDLANRGVTVALAADEVPAGKYARTSIELMGDAAEFPADFSASVFANVVTHETSVRSVAQKVALGEVDAGFVYETDAAADQYRDSLRLIRIPLHLNPAAQYPIAALAGSEHPESALAFIEFVLGDTGRQILRRYGFAPPSNVECPCADTYRGPDAARGARAARGADAFSGWHWQISTPAVR